MNIEEMVFKPDTVYLVRDDDHGVIANSLSALAKEGRIKNCMFIFLHGDERIEELSDERLAELRLIRQPSYLPRAVVRESK